MPPDKCSAKSEWNLARDIKGNKLETAHLEGKGFANDEALQLQEALKTTSALRSLTLKNCTISTFGATLIFNALGENTSIHSLILGELKGFKALVNKLIDALSSNRTLRHLALHPPFNGAQSVLRLQAVLCRHPVLETLTVHAPEGRTVRAWLARFAKENSSSSLTHLRLVTNTPSTKSCAAIKRLLKANTLKYLTLVTNLSKAQKWGLRNQSSTTELVFESGSTPSPELEAPLLDSLAAFVRQHPSPQQALAQNVTPEARQNAAEFFQKHRACLFPSEMLELNERAPGVVPGLGADATLEDAADKLEAFQGPPEYGFPHAL